MKLTQRLLLISMHKVSVCLLLLTGCGSSKNDKNQNKDNCGEIAGEMAAKLYHYRRPYNLIKIP